MWVRSSSGTPYTLTKWHELQERFLGLTSLCQGIKIDCFAWTTDGDWQPRGKGNFDQIPPAAPRSLNAKLLAEGHVRVSWEKNTDKDLRYYTVYAASDGKPEVKQTNLLLSPSRTYVIDWGVPEGADVSYAVTAVDRAGNESKPAYASVER